MKRNLLLFLAITGILISSYLFYAKLTSTPLYCGVGQGCDIVQNSKYSIFLGVPMGFWGMLYYFVLFTLFYMEGQYGTSRKLKTLTKLAIIWGLLFSIYLTALEEFAIGAYCSWCVVSFVNIIFISAISLINFREEKVK